MNAEGARKYNVLYRVVVYGAGCCRIELGITSCLFSVQREFTQATLHELKQARMWANVQRDGRPAEHRWRPLFNAAKFG